MVGRHTGSDTPDLHYLLEGVTTFRRDVFPANEELFKSLAYEQAPHTLFITCADSRISPEMITQTGPGELFVCRNIGNIVPTYGEMLGGVSAVVEYAVTVLNVRNIVVCGHSDCGAMKGLAAGISLADKMPTVHAWLRNAEAARSVTLSSNIKGDHIVHAITKENVRLQLTHLYTHPAVAARLSQGLLAVQGWVYDIQHGEVSILDDGGDRFLTLDEALGHLQRPVAP